MMKRSISKKILYILISMLAMLFLAACGNNSEEEVLNTEIEAEADSLYLILQHDTAEESLTLYSYETGKQYYFRYSFITEFFDKYGNHTTGTKFTEGRVVTIGKKNKDDYLTSVQLSDKVWEYEKVKRFSVDEDRGVFTIAGSNYSIQDEVMVFSNGEQIAFSDLSNEDILTVVGMEKKILSVVVTTGNGTLSLTNTELFEGSFLQLNSNIFFEITKNMEVELHEGTYTLTVANDGWGGSVEIEIVRGETTVVDLDELKGEGHQTGLITFEIDVEDVKVYIDNELIDHKNPVEVAYGTHLLEIVAEGYDTWQKYLVVHSETATIVVELTLTTEDDNDEVESESESEVEESETETESESETETESESESETESESESEDNEDESESESESEEDEEETESESESESEDNEDETESESESESESEEDEGETESETES